jgi:hypothetical protein
VSDDARLSRMLWEAREIADMMADITRDSTWPAQVRDEIDAYRAERGWSPNGFGGEDL